MKQPKALVILSLVQCLKFFSHYGVRALLVLYMVEQLSFSDSRALGVSAVFCGLVEVFGILGGVIADRYLGLNRATQLGSVLLAVGYSCLLLDGALFASLSLVVLGAALFNSNITAMLGAAYAEDDPRRKRGFTLFYMMQNLGALVATVICGVVSTQYGFRPAFAVAATGMVAGLVLLLAYRAHMPQEAKPQRSSPVFVGLLCAAVVASALGAIQFEEQTLILLPWVGMILFVVFGLRLVRSRVVSKNKLRLLFAYLAALILFFAAEDQCGSTLVLLAEGATQRTVFGYNLSSTVVMAVNPLVILLFATLVARTTVRLRFAVPFALVATGFLTMCFDVVTQSIFGIMGAVFVISLAELMIGPLVMSFSSEIAAKGSPGVVMGMVPIGFSLAFLLSGTLGKMVAGAPSYPVGFTQIALMALVGGILLEVFTRRYANEPATAAA